MKPKTAVYQGTFDPFTCGHLSVLKSARELFDEVVVLLLVNPTKTPLFSVGRLYAGAEPYLLRARGAQRTRRGI